MESRLTLAATSRIPEIGSRIASMPRGSCSLVISRTVPPAFCAAAPYDRPKPRAMIPLLLAVPTVERISVSSVVEITSATVQAVRPHPERRCIVIVRF